jgi:hypothetical protein
MDEISTEDHTRDDPARFAATRPGEEQLVVIGALGRLSPPPLRKMQHPEILPQVRRDKALADPKGCATRSYRRKLGMHVTDTELYRPQRHNKLIGSNRDRPDNLSTWMTGKRSLAYFRWATSLTFKPRPGLPVSIPLSATCRRACHLRLAGTRTDRESAIIPAV